MKKRRLRRGIVNFILFSGICILAFLLWMLWDSVSIARNIRIEAGTKVSPELFCKKWESNLEYSKNCKAFYPDVPGDYEVLIKKGIFTYPCHLTIQDTVRPTGIISNMMLPYGQEIVPEDFVNNIIDGTAVSLNFVKKPDMSILGTQQVSVQLMDLAGNETILNATCHIVPVKPLQVMEVGSSPVSANDLVVYGQMENCSLSMDQVDFDKLGEYDMDILVDGISYPCHMSIVDSEAPVITVPVLTATVGIDRDADYFKRFVKDSTDVIIELSEEPDYQSVGESYLTITVTDEAGNITERNMLLYVEEDTEAPDLSATKDFSVFQDETVSYRKYIHADDNSGEEPQYSIDASKVNTSILGDYPIVITATDDAGNEASKEVTVSVVKRTYTDEDLYERIDELLAKIITEDMDDTERARAIYDWAVNNIEYTGSSDKNNFNKAAISGLLDFKGDCYTNTTICVACFKRLGMDARVIRKVPIVSMYNHWWLIVKIDGYWYHMDTCPRVWDNPEMFLWTEGKMKAFSANHLETHNYDRSLYPAVHW